jgi:alpha-L-fucosidase 2
MNDPLESYNVVWDSPSKDASGSMPLGNGDIGINVWVEEGGDLLMLIGKSDAWDGNSINLKLGRIRIRLSPNPFVAGGAFQQILQLRTGDLRILASGVTIRIWVDANHSVIRLDISSNAPIAVQASLEMWRTQPRTIKTQTSDMFRDLSGKDPYPTVVWPDRIISGQQDRVLWCHHNTRHENDPYEINMKLQGLADFIGQMPHPLLGRTFGGAMEGDGFVGVDPVTLRSQESRHTHHLNIHALSMYPATVEQWTAKLEQTIETNCSSSREDHERWWDQFWNRSWIYVTTNDPAESDATFNITRGYILQRFMNAAAGRSISPIKHNGSLFSVGNPDDADFRRWGGPGWWFMNQRLIYWPMLAAGDYDLMLPWLRMYREVLPLARYRTQKYFGHGGAHFPETITFWGAEVSAHYGWTPFEQRPRPEAECPYVTYLWQGGIELTLILLNYYLQTGDEKFARDTLLPIADAVTEFYDVHYPRDQHGKLKMEPAQALETWHDATNPTPEVAGLEYTLRCLLDAFTPSPRTRGEGRGEGPVPKGPPSPAPHPNPLPEYGARGQELPERWLRMLRELPPLPIEANRILPAQRFDKKKNTENPELYCVFPYRLHGLNKPNLQLARDTFAARLHKSHDCWSQDDVQMAFLGLTEQAKESVTQRASPASHSDSRFPAFWNAFHDWIPDIDHGGVLQLALQNMLMQCDGREIRLLPAWPREWDADFKLHAPYQTIVEAKVRAGEIVELRVSPESRRGDVVVVSSANPAD